MEINKNELKIFNFYRKNLFEKISIRELTKRLKSKAYQRIYEAVNNLTKKDILFCKKIGNTNLIELKLTKESINILSYLDEQEYKKIPNVNEILNIKEISDFIILVTGSYAENKQTKKSDLDLVIIVPDKENVVSIQRLVENKTMLLKPEVHLYVLRKKDFIEMLTSKEENYGKTIVKKRIMIKNTPLFYELIKEGVEHGYKG